MKKRKQSFAQLAASRAKHDIQAMAADARYPHFEKRREIMLKLFEVELALCLEEAYEGAGLIMELHRRRPSPVPR